MLLAQTCTNYFFETESKPVDRKKVSNINIYGLSFKKKKYLIFDFSSPLKMATTVYERENCFGSVTVSVAWKQSGNSTFYNPRARATEIAGQLFH